MSDGEHGSGGWHTYRCPVCGHMDEVTLGMRPSCQVRCPHCDAVLQVEARGPEVARVTVRVVAEGGDPPC